ncbi:MAG: 30S ribosomal protein S8 [Candidatus Vidania fulgoroideorum]
MDIISLFMVELKNSIYTGKKIFFVKNNKIVNGIIKLMYRMKIFIKYYKKKLFTVIMINKKINTKFLLSIKRISKRSKRIFINKKFIKKTKDKLIIISTDKGIINNYEAIKQKKGGEIIFMIDV